MAGSSNHRFPKGQANTIQEERDAGQSSVVTQLNESPVSLKRENP